MLRRTTPEESAAVLRVSSLEPAKQVLVGLVARVAAGAGGTGQGAAQGGGQAGPRTADAPPGAGPHPVRSALLVTATVGAVVGAALAAWQRRERQATVDPWVAATTAHPDLAAPGDGPPAAPGTPPQGAS